MRWSESRAPEGHRYIESPHPAICSSLETSLLSQIKIVENPEKAYLVVQALRKGIAGPVGQPWSPGQIFLAMSCMEQEP
jgi:hypothetical protein